MDNYRITGQAKFTITTDAILAVHGIDPDQDIDGASRVLGLADYPIFDLRPDGSSTYRNQLNAKIIDQYRLREIGTESVERFAFMLRRRMHQIMPYYNQLYVSELIASDIDPMSTLDFNDSLVTTETQVGETSTGAKTDTDSLSRGVNSDTPQTRLAGNMDYATGLQDMTAKTTVGTDSTGTSSQTNRGEAVHSITGRQGHAAELLAAWRRTFLNIDMSVIDTIEPLWFGLWTTGDVFTTLRGNSDAAFGIFRTGL